MVRLKSHPQSPPPTERRYRLRGAAAKLFEATDGEVLLSGPAGTGKSLGCLLYLYHAALSFPGLRCLILRKTRASLTESALVTLERDVLPEEPTTPQRAHRRSYKLPNRSEIVCGGLDRVTRVMSTDWDLVYVQEAIELTEPEWEGLTTRLGRKGGRPYQRLIADTNPDRPTHWLKKRCDAGKCRLVESRHEDNPSLYDAAAGTWTDAGHAYLAKLDALTGPRRLRLRYGRWVQAEGVVYDGWNPAVHIVDRFPIPAEWPRYWVVDFGFTNPFVWQCWARDPDGRLFMYHEIYRSQRLVEDHAEEILRTTAIRDGGEPKPQAIICDHDAEDRATLERHLGLKTIAAHKDVSPGIQAVASRFRAAGDGKPRVFFLRDSLQQRDPVLVDAKRPVCTVEELDSYVWKESSAKEEPVKENDHGCDALRYLVAYFDLQQRRKLKVW